MTNIQDFSNAQGLLRTSAKMGYVDGIEFKNKTFYHNPQKNGECSKVGIAFLLSYKS